MTQKYSKLDHNRSIIPLYTLFCIKKQNHFYFFSKPVTIGTNARSIVYQHLFAQNCILDQDTIGYKRYKSVKKPVFTTI